MQPINGAQGATSLRASERDANSCPSSQQNDLWKKGHLQTGQLQQDSTIVLENGTKTVFTDANQEVGAELSARVTAISHHTIDFGRLQETSWREGRTTPTAQVASPSLSSGGNTDAIDLQSSIRSRNLSEVRRKNILDTLTESSRKHRSLLDAASRGDTDQLNSLVLEHGVNVNYVSTNLDTALTAATRGGHINAVSWLIINGASRDPIDTLGWTPLSLSIEANNFDMFMLLLGAEANFEIASNTGRQPIHRAATLDDPRFLLELLKRNANIQAETEAKETPLHCSVRAKTTQTTVELLDRGAKVDAQTKNGLTPAMVAAQNKQWDHLKLLAMRGASLDLCDNDNKTPKSRLEEEIAQSQPEEKKVYLRKLLEDIEKEQKFQALVQSLKEEAINHNQESHCTENYADAENALYASILAVTVPDEVADIEVALHQQLSGYSEKQQYAISGKIAEFLDNWKEPEHFVKSKAKEPPIAPFTLEDRAIKKIQAYKKAINKCGKELSDLKCENVVAILNKLEQLYDNFINALCSYCRDDLKSLIRGLPRVYGLPVGEHRLTHEHARRLLPEYGAKSSLEDGSRSVHSFGGVQWRLDPTSLGFEFQVASLYAILISKGIAPSQIIKVSDWRDNHHYVQVSKTVEGVDLQFILSCHSELIAKIDPYNYSALSILGRMMKPCNCKLGNMIVSLKVNPVGDIETLYLIISNNNGLDGSSSVRDRKIQESSHTSVHNILDFFPQMHCRIDTSFRRHFLGCSPEDIVIHWLKTQLRFNQEQCRGNVNEKLLEATDLPIRLVPGDACRIVDAIRQTQQAMNEDENLTHWQLFSILEPALVNQYDAIQKQHPNPMEAYAYINQSPSIAPQIVRNRTQSVEQEMGCMVNSIDYSRMKDEAEMQRVLSLVGTLTSLESVRLHNCTIFKGDTARYFGENLVHLKKLILEGYDSLTIDALPDFLIRHPNVNIELSRPDKTVQINVDSLPSNRVRVS